MVLEFCMTSVRLRIVEYLIIMAVQLIGLSIEIMVLQHHQ